MDFKLAVFLCAGIFVCYVNCHPTMYKYNENKKLEADLVPVSSTVIPLPVYQVSYGFNVGPSPSKDGKIKKPEGPITLQTIHNKKKTIPSTKPKHADVSSVKQITKTDFET